MWALLTLSLAAAAFNGPAVDGPDGPRLEAAYQQMLATAKQAPLGADWRRLRFGYADRPTFLAVEREVEAARRKMLAARRDHDWPQLSAQSQAVLDLDFADGQAHEMASTAFKETGREEDAAREQAISVAIFKSIQAADGLSAETALEVTSVREEYELMYARQRQVTMQSLVSRNGHSYDVLTTTGRLGPPMTFWFQIDRVLADEARMLSVGRPAT